MTHVFHSLQAIAFGGLAIAVLSLGCASAVPVGSVDETPAAASDPRAVDSVPGVDRLPSRPPTESARAPRESWSALVKAGRQHLHRDELDEAEDRFTRAYDLTRGFRAGDPRTKSSIRNLQRLASANLAAGDSTSFGRVMQLLVYISGEDAVARSPEFAQLLQELGATRLMQDRPTDARDALLLALSILEEDDGSSNAARVGVHTQLCVAHLATGSLEAAEAEIDLAAQLAAETEEPRGALFAKTLVPRADLELAKGNVDEARNALLEALEITEDQYGPESPAAAQLQREFALFEQRTGQNDEAEKHFDQVIAIWDALPNEKYQRAQSRNELAWFLVEIGQPQLAEGPARSGLGMLEEQEVGGQPLAAVADTLATALRDQEKYDEAEPLYQLALTEGAKAEGLAGWSVADIAGRYAELLDSMGRPEDADEMRRRWRDPASSAEPAGTAETSDEAAL